MSGREDSRELSPPTLADALSEGLDRYFTGMPCERGHIAERFTASRECVACADPEAAGDHEVALPGQVGWWCTLAGIGWFVLCFTCGGQNRPDRRYGRGGSRPLMIDDVRPHPQRCHRCWKTVVEGILTKLPDRWYRERFL